MNNCKYIVINSGGVERMFLFPNTLKHEDFAEMVTNGWVDPVVSAGFVNIDPEVKLAQCYGLSSSLGKDARPLEDGILLRSMLGLQDFRS